MDRILAILTDRKQEMLSLIQYQTVIEKEVCLVIQCIYLL